MSKKQDSSNTPSPWSAAKEKFQSKANDEQTKPVRQADSTESKKSNNSDKTQASKSRSKFPEKKKDSYREDSTKPSKWEGAKSKKDSGDEHQSKVASDANVTTNADIFDGVILGHMDGFAFFNADKKVDDIYLSAEEMFKALHGDRVRVKRIAGKSQVGKPVRYRGEIVEFLERPQTTLLGRLILKGKRWFFQPRDARYAKDFIISTRDENISNEFNINEFNPSSDEDVWVVAQVLNDGLLTSQPAVKVLHQLSGSLENMPYWQQSVLEKGAPYIFSQELLDSIDKEALAITADEYKTREDFRHLPFVTIDGETARDFDDAIYVEKQGSGFDLYVAIADVSRYIQPNTEIDKCAMERGNSIYFPEKVIPMLPEIYSNEWCSLNPKVDRLVMVCKMHINDKGNSQSYQFYEAIIHSHQRLTYTQVQSYLSSIDESPEDNGSNTASTQAFAFDSELITQSIDAAYQCYKKLRKARNKRGALDFDMPTTELVLDDEGNLERIALVHRNQAHTLIEEFMLAANVSAGEYIDANIKLGMYRVHDMPDEKKLTQLQQFLMPFNIAVEITDEPKPQMFMDIINQLGGDKEKLAIIQPMLLRAQQQAQYQSHVSQHFALNFPVYSHFTSPIRRYPDLCVHRLIRSLLRERPAANRFLKQLPSIARHCSMTERRADDMSRDVEAKLKLDFLKDNIGDHYEGLITGIKEFGLFVELKEVLVSGLVATTDLPKHYQYDEARQQLRAGSDSHVFSIGQSVTVQIVAIDVNEKRMDLLLVDEPNEPLA